MKTVFLASLILAVTSASGFAGTPWRIHTAQTVQSVRIFIKKHN
jgi:hypothetical protein